MTTVPGIPTFSSITINDLGEFAFIGGTEQYLYFNIYDSDGVAVALTDFDSLTWKLSPYGQPNYAVITATYAAGDIVWGTNNSGSPSNLMIVTLASASTAGLSGKYVQQPIIVDKDGITFRPSQGIITIIPKID